MVKIAAADAAKFTGVKLDQLRDRKSVFTFTKADVKAVEVQGPTGTTKMEFDGKAWKLTAKAYPELNASGELASTLIDRIEALQIAEFETKKGEFADPKTRVVRLFGDKNVNVVELKLGETIKKKVDGRDRALVPAKVGAGEVFTLDETSVRGLNLESFLEPVSVPPPKGPAPKEQR